MEKGNSTLPSGISCDAFDAFNYQRFPDKSINMTSFGRQWRCGVPHQQIWLKGTNAFQMRWDSAVDSPSEPQGWAAKYNSNSDHNWLVVGPPLWKIWKSIGMIIPNIWENKKCSKPPTSLLKRSNPDVGAQYFETYPSLPIPFFALFTMLNSELTNLHGSRLKLRSLKRLVRRHPSRWAPTNYDLIAMNNGRT